MRSNPPLEALRACISRAIASGAPVFVEIPTRECQLERATRALEQAIVSRIGAQHLAATPDCPGIAAAAAQEAAALEALRNLV